MKKLIKLLKYIVYHQTNDYFIQEISFPKLLYKEYYLYRIDKILFIPYKNLIDTDNSLKSKNDKRTSWYYTYLIKNLI